jgi:hypothetical protein
MKVEGCNGWNAGNGCCSLALPAFCLTSTTTRSGTDVGNALSRLNAKHIHDAVDLQALIALGASKMERSPV